jgi:cellulose synthase/poly-beta-1,6-N-acetylglucosamine synthase-like glycosyltransferase
MALTDPVPITLLVVLVVSLFLILHAYFLYPALLYVASKFFSAPSGPSTDDELPSVSLIIAAYNEEETIAKKIENSLELEYPSEKLHVLVFSDASTDRTDAIVESYADEGIELVRIEGRVGKTECQNRVAAMVDSDVLVFSDANSMYDPDAIRRLVSGFADGVGCVVGEVRHTQRDDDVKGESVYWSYKRLVKRLESKISSVTIGNGAIYAVRRADYVPLSPDLSSDFAEPLAIKRLGKAVKYAPDAVAWERTAGSVEVECSRKIRITTRSWHTMAEYLDLLNPFEYGFYAIQLFTNTVLWWSTPLLFATVLASSTALAILTRRPVFTLIIGGYALLFLLGLTGRYLERKETVIPNVLHTPYYFLVGNYSLIVGGWNFFRGRNIVTWETVNE